MLGDWQGGSSSRRLLLLLSNEKKRYILFLLREVETPILIDNPVGPQVLDFLHMLFFFMISEGTPPDENP